MSTTRGGRERERVEEKTRRRRRRRKAALSSEEEGETSSDDDDDEEEEEEEEELENESESEEGVDAKKGRRRKKGGRGKLPSKETIRNAFEELCRCDEAGKKEGETDGFTLQNLLDLCAKYGYHDWTLAEIENMLDAYDLSEARGEKKSSEKGEKDPTETTKKTVVVTERGFLEIVRKCGVREL